ncbi:hypothetical protein NDR87_19065 [Nocardia sp. CDC159]|uniref:Glycoside hydrolase family 19 catalytic domain-containing protein n=1 Tax=Nocardia pulmonis TaxID=2951408 RepID=A0A9X2E8Q4_9NOCA|nr:MULTISPECIES: glycoside hydrolase family 19 protein [Nocardia]MCM6776207.1 hypothetical protein [Nocardia pulmonis]MCM6788467.1 hypothetical protein [Nocardia sp. CDC159]
MTPSRSVLTGWHASVGAERLRAEFDRNLEQMEALSATVRGECRRLDGDGWQGAAFDAVLGHVEAVFGFNSLLCERAGLLRDIGVRALSDLHATTVALLDCVADAETDGCVVADDWTVTGDNPDHAAEWGEVIAEAAAAVTRADERGQRAVRGVLGEMAHLAALFVPMESLHEAALGMESEHRHPPESAEGTAVEASFPPRTSAVATQAAEAGITAEQLMAVMPNLPVAQAREYLPALNAALQEGDISTPLRQAAFLAQLAHESGELRYFEELGDAEYFRRYDPDGVAPAAGNTEPGDGPRYHGRGPIQLTGRANYRAAGAALGLDLEGDPDLAARPEIGFRIAQWYWRSRDINALVDAGDFAAVTRAVNGGHHGLAEREAYYRRALEVLR